MLVLLPGMDGTGNLFERFLASYSGSTQIVSLCHEGGQSHKELLRHFVEELPASPFILLAESFSGSFVPLLLSRSELPIKGIIFSASFLTPPNPLLRFIAPLLPVERMIEGDALHFFARLFLGDDVDAALIEDFISTVRSVPASALKARLCEIAQLPAPEGCSNLPALYMQGDKDRVVPPGAIKTIEAYLPSLERVQMNCAHGILQSCPQAAAELVDKFVRRHL